MTRFLFAAIFLSAFAVGVFAQDDLQKVKQFALDQLGPGKVVQTYNSATDKTTLTVPYLIAGDAPPFEGLTVSFTTGSGSGSVPAVRRDVSIFFLATGTPVKYGVSHSLTFTADGQKLKPGEGTYNARPIDDIFMEIATFWLSVDDLKKMAASKTVKAQFGPTEFTFNSSQLASLNEFYRKLLALK